MESRGFPMEKSITIYFVLVILLSICASVSVYLIQGTLVQSELPAPIPVTAFANFLLILAVYGSLGFLGLKLAKRIGFPEIWEKGITNRQRFLTQLAIGLILGVVLIVLDLVLSNFNSIGRLPHPSFPDSVVASISAGIGEEIVFRLFFISLFIWVGLRVLPQGKNKNTLFWVASLVSAILFSIGHFPSLMIML
jgi:membrane protease YdiL (CAAX protease family)